MVSFFQGLGDVAGGAAPALNQWLGQIPQLQALDAQGAAIRAAAGLPPQQQSGGLGSLFSGLGGLFGGQQPGVGASPSSGSSPLPSSQPMTAQPGGIGGGAQPGGQGQGITNLFQPPASPQGPQQGQQGTAAMPPPQSYSTPAGGPQGGQQFGMGGYQNPIYDEARAMYRQNPNLTNRQLGMAFGGSGSRGVAGLMGMTPWQAAQLNLRQDQFNPALPGSRAAGQAETGRHNRAEEGLRGATLEERKTEFAQRQANTVQRIGLAISTADKKDVNEFYKQGTDALKQDLIAAKEEARIVGFTDPKAGQQIVEEATRVFNENTGKLQQARDERLKQVRDQPKERAPAETATPAARVKVRTPADAQKLPPGTEYETPDGQVYTR